MKKEIYVRATNTYVKNNKKGEPVTVCKGKLVTFRPDGKYFTMEEGSVNGVVTDAEAYRIFSAHMLTPEEKAEQIKFLLRTGYVNMTEKEVI